MSAVGARRIILIRHAEKTGALDDPNLSELGVVRAKAMVAAFPTYFGSIDAIVAAQNSAHSFRPVQTVQPLAEALGLPILQRWRTADFDALALALTSSEEFAGQQVLVAWRHKSMHKFAMLLGPGTVPPWQITEYERFLVFDRTTAPRTDWFRQQLVGNTLRIDPAAAPPAETSA